MTCLSRPPTYPSRGLAHTCCRHPRGCSVEPSDTSKVLQGVSMSHRHRRSRQETSDYLRLGAATFYAGVARSRSGSSSFTALALNTSSSSSSGLLRLRGWYHHQPSSYSEPIRSSDPYCSENSQSHSSSIKPHLSQTSHMHWCTSYRQCTQQLQRPWTISLCARPAQWAGCQASPCSHDDARRFRERKKATCKATTAYQTMHCMQRSDSPP